MESTAAYESRALREAVNKEREVESSPLSERKEAQANFLEALKDPALVAERLGWLIDGNYGQGEMMRAKQVVKSPRMNRRAALTLMIGVYEWQCPSAMGIAAWKKLSKAEKDMLDRAVDIVISEAEKEE